MPNTPTFAAAAAALLAGCATPQTSLVEFAPLAGMTCPELAAEQDDVALFRDLVEHVELDTSDERETEAAFRAVDGREAEIADARRAQGCA